MPSDPAIGVTMDRSDRSGRYELQCNYTAAIEKAGGLPWAIPYRTDQRLIPQIVDRLDGILFTGGDDLDPALYGQPWHPQAIRIDPERQRFELALLAEVEKRRLPALGICLGSQLMNVHRGGSLHQFLPDVARDVALEHRKLDRDEPRHAVALQSGSILACILGRTEMQVNTYHKQAIDRVGRGLRVIATAPDGVIEGLEDPAMPLFLAIQWHPERLCHEPDHLAIFKLLVDRSRR